MTAVDRFLSRIQFDDDDKCWEWMAGFSNKYGAFYPIKGVQTKAHRYSYELFVDDIPDGLYIDHLCSNKKCVNPGHLEVVTKSENALRAYKRGEKLPNTKTHCVHGHEFTPDNVYFYKWRKECRICRRGAGRRGDAKRRRVYDPISHKKLSVVK